MRFTLTIDMDNDAFQTAEMELARILRRLSNDFGDRGTSPNPVRDLNGNAVGRWEIAEP